MDTLTILLINDAVLVFIAFVFLRVLMGKLPQITDFLRQTIKNDLEKWLNSDIGAKALYQIGALIGHGAVQGAGIQKTTGKFKWENLLGELASDWIKGNMMKKQNPPGAPAQAPDLKGLESA